MSKQETETFEEWWEKYHKSDECKLRHHVAWSHNEIGIIKEAMKDAYEKKVAIKCQKD